MNLSPETKAALHRLGHIVAAAAIALAFIGYFVGLTAGVAPHDVQQVSAASTDATTPSHGEIHDVAPAVGYEQMGRASMGPNANWRTQIDAAMTETNLLVEQPFDADKRRAEVDKRRLRRAYAGAPPVVPHPIDQRGAAACMVCHERGLRVGDVTAPRMSHEVYFSCTQCHVEANNLNVSGAFQPQPNQFEGSNAAGLGDRAWPGAPPTIPHATWMRENCNSCHNPQQNPGLATSHPWRQSCTQCHAPSADLDQQFVLPHARVPLVGASP